MRDSKLQSKDEIDKSGIHNRPARPPGADRKNPGNFPVSAERVRGVSILLFTA
jgi:hypothetical protein